ncbi:MAG: DNA replication and repair protein RecF [Magnetococcales bacterium]|nr:DNA replication and repair protein RecF [Magnetococcales bacterium]
MLLKSVRIKDFRNISAATLKFGEGLNLITGRNGEGKSNLLEAIGLLATGRSFRRAASGVMRRHGQGQFRVEAETQAGELTHQIDFCGEAQGQTVRLNGKTMAATSALGRALAAVIFTPETTARLIRGGPRERRNHLDWIIFSRRRGHAALVRDYQRALKARNRLLKGGHINPTEMSAWEAQLATLGAEITLWREHHLADLADHLLPLLPRLDLAEHRFELILSNHLLRSQQKEAKEVKEADEEESQVAELHSGSEAWQSLRQALQQQALLLLHNSRDNDRRMGTTTIGPHRDDLRFRMDGHALARYASQGQQKRFALGFKLAEAALVAEGLGEPPLVILDDPASELDRDGIGHLMALLNEQKGQVFLSTCNAEEIPWPNSTRTTFVVTAGDFKTGLK